MLLVLMLLAGTGLAWLLGTGAGLRFALARATAATDGALTVQHAEGRLAGPLDLHGLRYDDGKGTDIKLARAHLDLRLWPLLRGRLHVLDLQAEGIEVSLPTASAAPEQQHGSIDLRPPLDLQLDRVHLGELTVRQAGQVLFASHRIDLAGRWTSAGVVLQKLALDAVDGHAELAGKLAIGASYRGDGKASFSWKVGSNDYAGSLSAHSDGRKAHLQLALTAPTQATLQLDLDQTGGYPWTAQLDAPRFDPEPIIGTSSLHAVSVALHGNGDRHGSNLSGTLDLNGYPLQIEPLRARFSDDFNSLQLEQLALHSPRFKGRLDASGTLRLDGKPVSGDLDIRWQDLALPADLVGQALTSQGELHASGSLAAFHAKGEAAIGPPGKPSSFSLDLDGNQQQIILHSLALKQAAGGMQASGTLILQPVFGWQLDATARRLDPGQLLANWPGALNFDIASHGTLPTQGPDATLEIRQLDGQLRQRSLRGSGKLHLSSHQVLDGKLAIQSGDSRISVTALPGNSNNVDMQLAIATLGDWLPDASGHLSGHFNLRGKASALAINGTLNGGALTYRQQKIDQLQLIVGLPDISHPSGKIDLKASELILANLHFSSIKLHAEGSQASHQLSLDAVGDELSAALALSGSMKNGRWNGTLSRLDLEPRQMPGWHLQQGVAMSYADSAMKLSELCLGAGDPQLCVAANQDKAGNLDASYRLHALPLPLVLAVAGSAELPLRVDGSIQGQGKIRRSAAGALSGSATLDSARGSVTYADRPDRPLLDYRNLALQAQLSPARQQLNMHVELADGGHVEGQLAISGDKQDLSGQLTLQLKQLGFLELASSELAAVKGRLDGALQIGGTLAAPAITGQATVDGFAAEVPKAGLKLGSGKLTLATADAKLLRIDGQVTSGSGNLVIRGDLGLGADVATALTIKGSQFIAADIPSAKLVVSPDLQIRQSSKGIDIGGSVSLDSADVNLDKLPGAGATKSSPDVVIVDQKQQQARQEKMPVTASVSILLGNKTHLAGLGLDGKVKGQLVVHEEPGKATTGQGQIAVSGTYRAYGQNLHIARGQLLFASTPIDNPGLNIRAVRKLNPNATIDEGQEVGLLVSGTAQRPILTVFSNPLMEQSDALSYLVTGKPLSEVKGGEGNMVSAAAQALGSAGGDLLAKRIGSHLGVDDIGVSSSDALGGSSAFTVGKYLSPRLYLSYGVGLFDPGQVITLRYLLSHRWNFEAQNATDFSRASLNYRLEK
ncbi:MAG TPA: translocation/assembly module TamB domain-containing protein [Rhodanobacter sp.]|nr:translocation/assembly module TamB domain-containing protein [Rhodanobacter sp.]